MTTPLSRRDVMGAAALAAGATALGSAAAAQADAPERPTSPRSKQSNKHRLSKQKPTIVREHGTLSICGPQQFPVLAGNAGSAAFMHLDPGALREPHWHPDCWEMDIPISGHAELGVVNPDGTWSVQELGPGDIGFIPQGFAHYIENKGSEPAEFVLVFNADTLTNIGLSTMFNGMPTHTFTETFGLPDSGLGSADKGAKTLDIVR